MIDNKVQLPEIRRVYKTLFQNHIIISAQISLGENENGFLGSYTAILKTEFAERWKKRLPCSRKHLKHVPSES